MIALTAALSLVAAANPTASFETSMGSFTAELYMDRVVIACLHYLRHTYFICLLRLSLPRIASNLLDSPLAASLAPPQISSISQSPGFTMASTSTA